MNEDQTLVPSIYAGWHAYQAAMLEAIAPLSPEQLALRASPKLRSVAEIATHVVGARARWFYGLMGEGGKEFEALGKWDRSGAEPHSAEEIARGLEATWSGIHAAIARWTPQDWETTWPGKGTAPKIITRQWVIWHLIEHDLHHGGEISITLGAHGVPGLAL